MGLAERRAIKDFQDNHLPKLRTRGRTKTAIELMEKSL